MGIFDFLKKKTADNSAAMKQFQQQADAVIQVFLEQCQIPPQYETSTQYTVLGAFVFGMANAAAITFNENAHSKKDMVQPGYLHGFLIGFLIKRFSYPQEAAVDLAQYVVQGMTQREEYPNTNKLIHTGADGYFHIINGDYVTLKESFDYAMDFFLSNP